MRKITLLSLIATAIMFSMSLNAESISKHDKTKTVVKKKSAQSRTISTQKEALDGLATEGFDGDEDIPTGWSTLDSDDDGLTWFPCYFVDEDETPLAYGNNGSIYFYATESYYYDGEYEYALTPDNYLTTPQVNIKDGYSLSYFVCTIDGSYPSEKYEVLVSTSADASVVADYQSIYSQTLATPDTTWTEHVLDLSAYAGQDIYVSFRHHGSSDEYMMGIDDVTIAASTSSSVTTVKASNLNIFPNPAETKINIHHNVDMKSISIYNFAGKEVYSEVTNSRRVQLAASSFQAGMYIVKAMTESGMVSKPLCIE